MHPFSLENSDACLPDRPRGDKLTWLSRLLSLTGLVISVVSRLLVPAPRPYGIPLPLFGVAGYLALLVTACMRGPRARTLGMLFTVIAVSASAVSRPPDPAGA